MLVLAGALLLIGIAMSTKEMRAKARQQIRPIGYACGALTALIWIAWIGMEFTDGITISRVDAPIAAPTNLLTQ